MQKTVPSSGASFPNQVPTRLINRKRLCPRAHGKNVHLTTPWVAERQGWVLGPKSESHPLNLHPRPWTCQPTPYTTLVLFQHPCLRSGLSSTFVQPLCTSNLEPVPEVGSSAFVEAATWQPMEMAPTLILRYPPSSSIRWLERTVY
jgi:hypothetical protein